MTDNYVSGIITVCTLDKISTQIRGGTVWSNSRSVSLFFSKKGGQRMEQVDNIQDNEQMFENDIEMWLDRFCDEQKIDDLREITQNVWNAALMYVRRHVFFDKKILKEKGPLEGYRNNNYSNEYSKLNMSNCNKYNIELVDQICDYYIYLCMLYSKEVSIVGFGNLTGISSHTIHQWGNEDRRLSTASFTIYQKLVKFNEESLANLLISSKRSPVGAIATLNHRHGWASPYTSDSNAKTKGLTAGEIRALLSEQKSQNVVQIAQQENEV